MMGAGAPVPRATDFQHQALLGLLAALSDPKATAKLLETWKRESEIAVHRKEEAHKAVEALKAKEAEHDARERALKVREDNAARVEAELQLRQKELRDLADRAVNDRNRAAAELADARETAKGIISQADAHAGNAETKAKGALQQHGNVTREITQLEKQRDHLKAELRAIAARIGG